MLPHRPYQLVRLFSLFLPRGARGQVRRGLLLLALAGVVATCGQGRLFAADQLEPPDLVAWDKVATRAEAAIELGRASDLALESLRTRIDEWRRRFASVAKSEARRIPDLTAEIEVLGYAGDQIQTEGAGADQGQALESGEEAAPTVPERAADATLPAADIAGVARVEVEARRQELLASLEQIQTHIRAAEAGAARAQVIIDRIDQTLRERQAAALVKLGPSPLNPAHWPAAAGVLFETLSAILRESWALRGSQAQLAALVDNLPLLLLFGFAGLLAMLRGPHLLRLGLRGLGIAAATADTLPHAEDELQDIAAAAREHLSFALTALACAFLRFAGFYLLIEALLRTGLVGLRGSFLVDAMITWGAIIIFGHWLTGRIFASTARLAVVPLQPPAVAKARVLASSLGLMFVLNLLLQELARIDRYGAAEHAVLAAPVLVAAGLILVRIARLMHHRDRYRLVDEVIALEERLVTLLTWAGAAVGLMAPLLAVIGYGVAAANLVYPFIQTLALIGLALVLERIVGTAYRALTGRPETGSLVPVLAGFVLTLASLPLLALVWGARVTDIEGLWVRLNEGMALGDLHIAPGDIATIVIVLAAGLGLTRVAQNWLRLTVLPRTRIEPGGRAAMVSGFGYIGIGLSAVIAVTAAGVDLSGLAIVVGALSLGIGFGLQNIVSNFISGLILLIERPIAEGDWIEVGQHMGTVSQISVRSTRIEAFDRTSVIIPNTDLIGGTVINWTKGNKLGRLIVPVGVAYGTDTRKVERILCEIANNHPIIMEDPPPMVVFQGFGTDALNFELRGILSDVNFILTAKSDLNHAIAQRFAAEGIEVPFAQRVVWLKHEQGAAGSSAASAMTPATAGVVLAEPARP